MKNLKKKNKEVQIFKLWNGRERSIISLQEKRTKQILARESAGKAAEWLDLLCVHVVCFLVYIFRVHFEKTDFFVS